MKALSPEVQRLQDEQAKQKAVRAEYKDKQKVKALTTAERIDRIEKMLGVDK